MFNLVVTNAFGGYAVGETITDSDKIDAALETHAAHVVRVAAPEVEEPAPEPVRTTFRDAPTAPAPETTGE